MKKILIITTLILASIGVAIAPVHTTHCATFTTDAKAKASILVDSTGQNVLYSHNATQHLPVASIVKLMTALLTFERLDDGTLSLDDKVIVSEHASGMGGSQIFLDTGAEYTVENLLKSVIVCSANDSAVALAEHIAGSEESFVKLMNEKACVLNMTDTNYENCNGLPAPNQYSSASDIAKLMCAIIKYPLYNMYSKIWLEDFIHPSGRINQMANTNKLIRHYDGCESGKTGSTNEAGYCLSVSAKRNNMYLVSVVLGAENSKMRFKYASDLLNYGFANFDSISVLDAQSVSTQKVAIQTAKNRTLALKPARIYTAIIEKNTTNPYTVLYHLPDRILSITSGDIVGTAEIIKDGIVVDTIDILADETVEAPSLFDYFNMINSDFVA